MIDMSDWINGVNDDPPEYPELPKYAEALFFGVWGQISRVFWNKNQRAMSQRGEDDPCITGFTVRQYCWDDGPDSLLPNFVFGEAELRWYKYPGRSMTANVTWEPAQWVAWFDAALAAIKAYENACKDCGEIDCNSRCMLTADEPATESESPF